MTSTPKRCQVSPSGVDVIGLEHMLASETVAALNEVEGGQGVEVVVQGFCGTVSEAQRNVISEYPMYLGLLQEIGVPVRRIGVGNQLAPLKIAYTAVPWLPPESNVGTYNGRSVFN